MRTKNRPKLPSYRSAVHVIDALKVLEASRGQCFPDNENFVYTSFNALERASVRVQQVSDIKFSIT